MHAVWLWEHDDIGVEIPLLGHVFLQCLLHALELIIFVYSIRGEQVILNFLACITTDNRAGAL